MDAYTFQLTGSAFLAAFGGALALFLGLSFAMMLEVVEFIIDLGFNIFLYYSEEYGKKACRQNTVSHFPKF